MKQRLQDFLEQYGEITGALASGVLMAIAWILGHYTDGPVYLIYLAAYIIGGYVKAKEGLITLVKEKDLDVNLLMLLAAVGAACIGYWAEGAMLIFIFALSGALETFTMNRSSKDLSALMGLKPETAILFQDGKETEVPIGSLEIGQIVIVKPGERIPADGIVKEGVSAVDQASITGESLPVDKTAGSEVFAGTLNGQGALFVEVKETSESSLFSKIIKLVQEAQSEMPKSQVFMEKFERVYARVILLVTAVLMFLPHYVFGWSWNDTFYKAMVFLVVASPCALVASIMPAVLSAISNGARKGLLFKGGAHIENLAQVNVIAFDKTGTLTQGKLAVTDVHTFQGYTEQQFIQIAASLESLSAHPIAKAIVQKAKDMSLEIRRPMDFESHTGWGIEASYCIDSWKIGKPGFVEENLKADPQVMQQIRTLEKQGKTVIALQNSQGIAGIIGLQDRVRPEVKSFIAKLRESGVRVAMLTGDQKMTAHAIAEEAGIDANMVYAELLPEDKLNVINELKAKHGKVGMVGDGVNDAPALATASVGIAMGVMGSDAALETADIILMNDDLNKIHEAIVLGRRLKKIVKQNMIFALTIIASLIISNFVIGVPLPLGVVGHEGSTILVILNGLRLLR
ncbi:heavy metal translocating P-type ATPase [Paenibacillus sp. N1-5-1-14]|uniref:heavy metal translocating P-type ATPase n=1 Tax=Paenibacillus radicibacter TaxID=2972488 RepID=UPI0021590BEC|nr:heavy metal translocating P-type ATPase [Paenibacillus radicibacter]MCR8644795.1 heavy metal translocating P-type ATPase [Paenibacillus radicibacter]